MVYELIKTHRDFFQSLHVILPLEVELCAKIEHDFLRVPRLLFIYDVIISIKGFKFTQRIK